MEATNRLIQRLLEEIKLIQNNTHDHTAVPINFIIPKTPFHSKDEFINFERKIEDSEGNFQNLVNMQCLFIFNILTN